MRRFPSVAIGAVLVATLFPHPSAHAKDAYCGEMAKLAKELDKIDFGNTGSNPKAAAKEMKAGIKLIKASEGKAPAKVKADLVVVRSALDKLASILSKFSASDVKDPKKAAAYVQALTAAADPKFEAASTRLETFSNSCGIKSKTH